MVGRQAFPFEMAPFGVHVSFQGVIFLRITRKDAFRHFFTLTVHVPLHDFSLAHVRIPSTSITMMYCFYEGTRLLIETAQSSKIGCLPHYLQPFTTSLKAVFSTRFQLSTVQTVPRYILGMAITHHQGASSWLSTNTPSYSPHGASRLDGWNVCAS